jgi:hypothetical protein
MFSWLRRNLEVYRSDFGRNFGWWVELDGKRLTALVDAVWLSDDQFWHLYRIVPLTSDPQDVAAISSEAFWFRPGVMFINQRYGTRVTDAVAGPVWGRDGVYLIMMRHLFVPVRFPLLWEFVCLFLPTRKPGGP